MKNKKKKKISTKILKYTILLAVFAVGVSVFSSIFSIFQVRKETQDIVSEIQKEQKAGNTEAILEQITEEVKTDSSAYALQYSEKFKQFMRAIDMCNSYISNVVYSDEAVPEPGKVIGRDEDNGFGDNLYYCLPKGSSYEAMKDEIDKFGSAKDFFRSISASVFGYSIYYATKDGLMITMDDNSSERISAMMDPDNIKYFGDYDPRDREWYKDAVTSDGEYVFSEVYQDTGGGEVMTCSIAVYANGEFQGVLAIDFSYYALTQFVVPNSERAYQEYYEVITDDGKPVVEFLEGEDISYIDIFGEEEFKGFSKELMKLSEREYPNEDDNLIYKNIIVDDISYKGKEYICAGINIRFTNLYYVMFVEKEQALEIHTQEIERQLRPFRDLGDKIDTIIVNMVKNFVVITLLVIGLVIIISKVVSGKISKPINGLITDVQEIGSGNLEHKVEIHTNDELEILGNVFNQMTASLTQYMDNLKKVTMEQERISTELNMASTIQSNMLPKGNASFPNESAFEVSAFMRPAKEVGGDYYDYFMLDDRYVVSIIADVSGKGMPAALFMMMGKTLMRSQTNYQRKPAEIMKEVNRYLNENNDEMMFITSFLSILDLVTGELVYANAGHNPPLLYRKEQGAYEYVEQEVDIVLAVMEDSEYKEHSLKLKPGDKLFLYTDGVTEAMDKEGVLFGDNRLKEILNRDKVAELSGDGLLTMVMEEITSFAAGAEQADDITMLALSYEEHKCLKREENGTKELVVAADLSELNKVLDFISTALKEKNVNEEEISKVHFVADEMFSNIAMYAYKENAGDVVFSIDFWGSGKITICIEDKGVPYNPLDKAEPDVDKPLEEREIGGLGIYLVKNSVENMTYCYEDNKNKLKIEMLLEMS